MATADCTFCAIVHGDRPASIVYGDTATMAFMNIRQSNAGHVLVIPSMHVETVDALIIRYRELPREESRDKLDTIAETIKTHL